MYAGRQEQVRLQECNQILASCWELPRIYRIQTSTEKHVLSHERVWELSYEAMREAMRVLFDIKQVKRMICCKYIDRFQNVL